jgi:hypothetical protein
LLQHLPDRIASTIRTLRTHAGLKAREYIQRRLHPIDPLAGAWAAASIVESTTLEADADTGHDSCRALHHGFLAGFPYARHAALVAAAADDDGLHVGSEDADEIGEEIGGDVFNGAKGADEGNGEVGLESSQLKARISLRFAALVVGARAGEGPWFWIGVQV